MDDAASQPPIAARIETKVNTAMPSAAKPTTMATISSGVVVSIDEVGDGDPGTRTNSTISAATILTVVQKHERVPGLSCGAAHRPPPTRDWDGLNVAIRPRCRQDHTNFVIPVSGPAGIRSP